LDKIELTIAEGVDADSDAVRRRGKPPKEFSTENTKSNSTEKNSRSSESSQAKEQEVEIKFVAFGDKADDDRGPSKVMGRSPSRLAANGTDPRGQFPGLTSRRSNYSPESWTRLEQLFYSISGGSEWGITRDSAMGWFKGNFAKLSVEAMFSEVDVDNNGSISGKEFANFWVQVRKSGYSEEDVMEEIEELLKGGHWVDWKDDRDVQQERGAKTGSKSDARNFVVPKPKRCRLSEQTWSRITALYVKMAGDPNFGVTKKDGLVLWGSAFGMLSAEAMLNDVDADCDGVCTKEEFAKFWNDVSRGGYPEDKIREDVDMILEGGQWVDFQDRRSAHAVEDSKPARKGSVPKITRSATGGPGSFEMTAPPPDRRRAKADPMAYPKRPRFCRLSAKAWKKVEDLYNKMDNDAEGGITLEEAKSFFSGTFGKLSAEAMFREVDQDSDGTITGKEFAAFWVQVRKAGYSEAQVLEELDDMLEGSTWVDWKDGCDTGDAGKRKM